MKTIEETLAEIEKQLIAERNEFQLAVDHNMNAACAEYAGALRALRDLRSFILDEQREGR